MIGRMREACAENKKDGMGGPHGGTIGEANKNSMSGGNQIGTGSCGAKEMATVARVGNGTIGRVVLYKRSNGQIVRNKIYFSCSLPISGGRFVCYYGSTFAFGTCGIMFVASFRFRASLAGVITAMDTITEVVVSVGSDGTCGKELALEIGDAGL